MKLRNLFFPICLALSAFVVSGCVTPISNLTPKKVPENPSGIYTFSFAAKINHASVIPGTVKASIVIDGEEHIMSRSDLGRDIYDFEYKLPPNRATAKYYYVLRYQYDNRGIKRNYEEYSDVFEVALTNKYVYQLESSRGPVGATITVLGRNFTESDRLTFDGLEIPTDYQNSHTLRFTVPSLTAGQTYQVSLRTDRGDIPVGPFRIDSASFSVSPSSLDLMTGERTFLIVTVPGETSSEEGLYVDVTTDVPNSVIMPEVIIPYGARSINVPVEGGEPGRGTLYIEAPGYKALEIPINVR